MTWLNIPQDRAENHTKRLVKQALDHASDEQ
jgi:hypothetical protein